MPTEWRRVLLGELYDIRSGLSKPKSAFGSGYPFLGFKDVFDNYFVPSVLTQLVNSTESERHSGSIHRGDVFLTRTSETMEELGMSCVALADYENATFNGFTKRLRPKRGIEIAPEYAGFFFRSGKFRQAITAMSSLSTRASLNNEMIARLEMTLPPIDEQKAIGSMLKSFDDKIDVNRRMSETLEEIARTLFRSRFVTLDESAGWEVRGLDQVALFLNGLALQKYPSVNGRGLPVIKIAQLRRGDTVGSALASDEIESDYIVNDGDVLFSWSGSLECRLWSGGRGALNQHLFKVTSDTFPKWFYYLWIREHLGEFRRIAAAKATTMGHIQRHHLSEAEVLVPPGDVMSEADQTFGPIFDRLLNLALESRTLAALRDTLLPKLISGELRIPVA